MRKALLAALILAPVGGVAWRQARYSGKLADGSFLIPTGQRLTPAGRHIEVADRPLGMRLSPDGRLLAVVTGSNSAPRALHLIDAVAARLLDTLPFGDSFVGVAFHPGGRTLYVGGGRDHDVKILRRSADQRGFLLEAAVKIPGAAPSGVALSGDAKRLHAALNLKHSVAMIDLGTLGVP